MKLGFGFSLSDSLIIGSTAIEYYNELLDTQDYSTGNWIVNNLTKLSDGVGEAPDSGDTQRWATNPGGYNCWFEQTITGLAGRHIFSWHVRWPDDEPSETYQFGLHLYDLTDVVDWTAKFSWLKGDVPHAGWGTADAKGRTDEGGGWYRFYLRQNSDLEGHSLKIAFKPDFYNWRDYSMYAWGVQGEATPDGTVPSAYQPRGGA